MGEATARSADLLERAIGPTRPPSAWQSLPKVVESKTGWLNDQREAAGACQSHERGTKSCCNPQLESLCDRQSNDIGGFRAEGNRTGYLDRLSCHVCGFGSMNAAPQNFRSSLRTLRGSPEWF